MEHVVKAGLITEAEAKLMEKPNAGYSGNKWWMPLVWATKIVDMVSGTCRGSEYSGRWLQ